MKKYFEPELTVIQFNVKDVLASSELVNYNKPIYDENNDPWSPYL